MAENNWNNCTLSTHSIHVYRTMGHSCGSLGNTVVTQSGLDLRSSFCKTWKDISDIQRLTVLQVSISGVMFEHSGWRIEVSLAIVFVSRVCYSLTE